ncbi:hypothetical protein [Streptomyces melanogenes]|uniref:Uncharacterized protein n=1 Tax=Streptomyces melanogenes TaxID=67326 RepID=A0ABZ1XDE8_9ACTN|nr:hypothetical protein [Streptomyces melanogenes]
MVMLAAQRVERAENQLDRGAAVELRGVVCPWHQSGRSSPAAGQDPALTMATARRDPPTPTAHPSSLTEADRHEFCV